MFSVSPKICHWGRWNMAQVAMSTWLPWWHQLGKSTWQPPHGTYNYSVFVNVECLWMSLQVLAIFHGQSNRRPSSCDKIGDRCKTWSRDLNNHMTVCIHSIMTGISCDTVHIVIISGNVNLKPYFPMNVENEILYD